MDDTPSKRDIIADQRYFHLILLREIQNYSLSDYWIHIGDTIPVFEESPKGQATVVLEHRRLISDVLYSRGSLLNDLSASNDGRPPYYFLVITICFVLISSLALGVVTVPCGTIITPVSSCNLRIWPSVKIGVLYELISMVSVLFRYE